MLKPSKMRAVETRKNQAPSYCMTCPKVATKEALFELENCTIVRRYCDECSSAAEYETPLQ